MYKQIGIDIGNHSIKTSALVSFDARIEEEGAIEGGTCHKITIKGKTFNIGKGSYDPELDKVNKKYFTELLASAIALSTDSRDVEICLGLPVNYYDAYKDKLIERVRENRYLNFKFSNNGESAVERTVLIRKVKVVPEAVGAFCELYNDANIKQGSSALILDIGGLTVDSCIIDADGTVKSEVTEELGMIDFYNNVYNKIKSRDLRYKGGSVGIDKIIKDGFVIKYPNGNVTDATFIKDMIQERAIEIFDHIRSNYSDYDNHSIIVCGGGVKVLKDELSKLFYGHYFTDDRFANAKGFLKLYKNGTSESNKPTVLIDDWEVEDLLKSKGKVADLNA